MLHIGYVNNMTYYHLKTQRFSDRNRLAKSILIVLKSVPANLQAVSGQRGKRTVAVMARGSSIECSGCAYRVEKP